RGALAGRMFPEAKYVAANTHVAEPVGVKQMSSVLEGQNPEGQAVQVAVGREDQPPAIAEGLGQRGEDGGPQPLAGASRLPAACPTWVGPPDHNGSRGPEVVDEAIKGLGRAQAEKPGFSRWACHERPVVRRQVGGLPLPCRGSEFEQGQAEV